VVDLTSTGTTLAENHLKEIAGGTVLQTEACLIASLRSASWGERPLAALEQFVAQIEARIRATSQLVLRFSVPAKTAAKSKRQLAEKFDCVVNTWPDAPDASDKGRAFVVAYCQRGQLYGAVKFLKSCDAASILVERGEFIFEGFSPAFETFRKMLKHPASAEPRIARDH